MINEIKKETQTQSGTLLRSNEGLRAELDQLKNENKGLREKLDQTKSQGQVERNSRRAALSLMEDAVHARGEADRIKEALRESEEQFRRAIEEAPIPVIMQAEDGQVLQVSATWTELTGYTREDTPTLDAWLHHAYGQGADLVRDYMQQLFSGEKRQIEIEFQVTTRAGELRYWSFSASAPGMLGDGRRFIVGMALDVTERQQASHAAVQNRLDLVQALEGTERARAEAENASRTKDQFLAILSHELRTPLTPVLLASQVLLRRADLPQSFREALEMIRRNVEVESRLVDDLLDVTRISRGKMELVTSRVDLHQVVLHAVEISRPDIDAKEQRLEMELAAIEYHLDGDSPRLMQAVWNLLKNASKFTPAQGKITLRTRNDPNRFIVEISDTGIGIEADALSSIFDPFTQGSHEITREFGGLGLGLAIAQASVAGHGGELTATSEGPGHGATFVISLPVADRE